MGLMMRQTSRFNWPLATVVVIAFVLFQFVGYWWGAASFKGDTEEYSEYFKLNSKDSHISRIYNLDASLSVPFLDRVNKFWHVGGNTQVRNHDFIRLTRSGQHNDYGVLISNGIGDNTINDFEIILQFKISHSNDNGKQSSYGSVGDGMVLVITPENSFMTEELGDEESRRKFKQKYGGLIGENKELMGFPKNLPGLAIVLDTFKHNNRDRKTDHPFLDALLNVSPTSDWYDQDSDSMESTSLKLNKNHILLKDSVVEDQLIKLRVIYLESISFLKIDIQYANEEDYWIELFQTTDNVFIPKNIKTGQRYIGIGASTGALTENVDILDVQTNEFHWDNHDESSEESFDYAKEVQKFLAKEYGQRIAFEMDKYKKLQMLKAQPNYQMEERTDLQPKPSLTISAVITRTIVFTIILGVGYYLSKIRYDPKTSKIKRKAFGLLPE